MLKKLIPAFALIIFLIGGAALWFAWSHFIGQSMSQTSEEVVYEVAPGLSFRAVAKDLEKNGLIKNADFFVLLAKFRGGANKMKVGEYLLNKNMKPNEVLAQILSGKSIERSLTISEGLSIFEIAEIFDQGGLASAKEVLSTIQDPTFVKETLGEEQSSLEGYLFPETYSFTKYTDYKTILAQMVNRFKIVYAEVAAQSKLQTESSLPNWSRHKVVTLASIIEKETGAPNERPLISSVFHNRLRKGMLLQTDPTIIYGKAMESGKLEINITKADIARPTSYNTYVIKGLPPGPIANPGKEALLAAVKPVTSSYLYFVSHNDGTHQFSEDYKNHLQAVQKFQLDAKARQGKSWRDLSKKTDKTTKN